MADDKEPPAPPRPPRRIEIAVDWDGVVTVDGEIVPEDDVMRVVAEKSRDA